MKRPFRIAALLLVSLLPIASICYGQGGYHPFINLDFERQGTFSPWAPNIGSYDFDLDTKNPSHGKACFLISFPGPESSLDTSTIAAASAYFPITTKTRPKTHVQIAVDIRTENISVGSANFAAVALSSNYRPILESDLAKESLKGTLPWKRYSVEFDCDSATNFVGMSCRLHGNGKVWFDHITIKINGEDFPDGLPLIPEPSPSETAELKKRMINLNPNDQGSALQFKKLDPFFENARVLGLGESTYGSHETAEMKASIAKYLITEKGFTHIAFEANSAETEKINEYVHSGKGNLDSLIKDLHFWCWMTQEVRGFIEWLKEYTHTKGKNVELVGIDMQFVETPAHEIIKYVNALHTPHAKQIERLCTEYLMTNTRLLGGEYVPLSVLGEIADSTYELMLFDFRKSTPHHEDSVLLRKVILYADNLREFYTLVTSANGMAVRDSAMALNLWNILGSASTKTTSAKAIVWSHNMHQWKAYPFMGYFLKKEFGADFSCIGFAFDNGSYNGYARSALQANEALPSYPGSFEYLCKSLNNKPFFVDLRPNSNLGNPPKVLYQKFDHRDIGFSARKFGFSPLVFPTNYDAVIYIPQSTPSHLLDFAK